MKFTVLLKQTPDTAELPKITPEQALAGNQGVTKVVNPWDEYAVEEGIRLKERFGGETVAMSMGPDEVDEALKSALAMGCDRAVRLWDESFEGSDVWGTALVLAKGVEKDGGADVILTGKMSVDGNSGAVAHGVACKLGVSLLTQVAKIVDISDGMITVERLLDEGRETVRAPLPAVVSVVKEINEPRYPTFIRIRKASRAKIPVLTAADLGLSPDQVGAAAAKVKWTELVKPPAKKREVVIIEGETPEEKARKLLDYLMNVEKVI
ncbi:MAG: electron transfer flavoprotein subunit beta/FixA family protein [Chloroflexi bacterium]|nr:electron transfer flavoprotein subunit beta/FixA family protein [Chloroflexota bacterium]